MHVFEALPEPMPESRQCGLFCCRVDSERRHQLSQSIVNGTLAAVPTLPRGSIHCQRPVVEVQQVHDDFVDVTVTQCFKVLVANPSKPDPQCTVANLQAALCDAGLAADSCSDAGSDQFHADVVRSDPAMGSFLCSNLAVDHPKRLAEATTAGAEDISSSSASVSPVAPSTPRSSKPSAAVQPRSIWQRLSKNVGRLQALLGMHGQHVNQPIGLTSTEHVEVRELDPASLMLDRRVAGRACMDGWVGKYKGKQVVVKRFGVPKANTIDTVVHELRLLSQIRHPNLSVYLGHVTDPEVCVVAECLPRASTLSLLTQQHGAALSDHVTHHIAASIARAVYFLHTRQPSILHLDLKSGSVLVDDRWRVKVSDYGLASVRAAVSSSVAARQCTPEWMAPELLRGEPAHEAADIFSWGVLVWELLQGSVPWEGVDPMQVVGFVGYAGRTLPPPSRGSPLLCALCTAAMAWEASQRPTFANVLAALQGYSAMPGVGPARLWRAHATSSKPAAAAGLYATTWQAQWTPQQLCQLCPACPAADNTATAKVVGAAPPLTQPDNSPYAGSVAAEEEADTLQAHARPDIVETRCSVQLRSKTEPGKQVLRGQAPIVQRSTAVQASEGTSLADRTVQPITPNSTVPPPGDQECVPQTAEAVFEESSYQARCAPQDHSALPDLYAHEAVCVPCASARTFETVVVIPVGDGNALVANMEGPDPLQPIPKACAALVADAHADARTAPAALAEALEVQLLQHAVAAVNAVHSCGTLQADSVLAAAEPHSEGLPRTTGAAASTSAPALVLDADAAVPLVVQTVNGGAAEAPCSPPHVCYQAADSAGPAVHRSPGYNKHTYQTGRFRVTSFRMERLDSLQAGPLQAGSEDALSASVPVASGSQFGGGQASIKITALPPAAPRGEDAGQCKSYRRGRFVVQVSAPPAGHAVKHAGAGGRRTSGRRPPSRHDDSRQPELAGGATLRKAGGHEVVSHAASGTAQPAAALGANHRRSSTADMTAQGALQPTSAVNLLAPKAGLPVTPVAAASSFCTWQTQVSTGKLQELMVPHVCMEKEVPVQPAASDAAPEPRECLSDDVLSCDQGMAQACRSVVAPVPESDRGGGGGLATRSSSASSQGSTRSSSAAPTCPSHEPHAPGMPARAPVADEAPQQSHALLPQPGSGESHGHQHAHNALAPHAPALPLSVRSVACEDRHYHCGRFNVHEHGLAGKGPQRVSTQVDGLPTVDAGASRQVGRFRVSEPSGVGQGVAAAAGTTARAGPWPEEGPRPSASAKCGRGAGAAERGRARGHARRQEAPRVAAVAPACGAQASKPCSVRHVGRFVVTDDFVMTSFHEQDHHTTGAPVPAAPPPTPTPASCGEIALEDRGSLSTCESPMPVTCVGATSTSAAAGEQGGVAAHGRCSPALTTNASSAPSSRPSRAGSPAPSAPAHACGLISTARSLFLRATPDASHEASAEEQALVGDTAALQAGVHTPGGLAGAGLSCEDVARLCDQGTSASHMGSQQVAGEAAVPSHQPPRAPAWHAWGAGPGPGGATATVLGGNVVVDSVRVPVATGSEPTFVGVDAIHARSDTPTCRTVCK